MVTGSSYWPVIPPTTIREGQTNPYGMALSVLWRGQVHPQNCWFPIGVQWAAIVEIFEDDHSPQIWIGGLVGVYNLVKDDLNPLIAKYELM